MSRVVLTPATLHCRDLVRKTDPDRLLLAELAPPAHRPALWALAAFNWEVARIPERVSEPMLGAIRRQWWRDAWGEIAAGSPRHHPVVEALAEAHAATSFDLAVVEAMLLAREAEHDGPPADLPTLIKRAEQIGGGLARLEAAALACDGSGAAAQVGTAWNLMAGLRGLPQLLHHGRHQLPEALLAEHAINLDRLDPAAPPPDFGRLIEAIGQTADAHLADTGSAAAQRLPPLFRGYRQLALLYRNRLRAAGWNPFDARINAPTFGRAWRVVQVRLGIA
jgi:NADH dehydrogenase [ubiquinone] 1 alpha subcomplex assembly factor 6